MSNVFQNFMTFFSRSLWNKNCFLILFTSDFLLVTIHHFLLLLLPWFSRRCLTNNNNIKLYIHKQIPILTYICDGKKRKKSIIDSHTNIKYSWFEKKEQKIITTKKTLLALSHDCIWNPLGKWKMHRVLSVSGFMPLNMYSVSIA